MGFSLDGVACIDEVNIWPIDVQLKDPFAISSGTVDVAQNLYVSITVSGGVKGYGEIAPFEQITGETRERSYAAARRLTECLIGKSLAHYRHLSRNMREREPDQPAARCGLETALLDALCRKINIPLWSFWGGACLEGAVTDVTIPLLDCGKSLEIAEYWYKRGLRTFKIKVGSEPNTDLARLKVLSSAFPSVPWILDANEGFTETDALYFIREASKLHGHILYFEQPTASDDIAGLAAIRRQQGVPIMADESVFTVEDALKVIRAEAADAINIKIMKSGVLEAVEIIAVAQGAGIGLMAGGMVETRVAMGCSLGLALGFGCFSALDLDTPLLLDRDPVRGGYQYLGAELSMWRESGLGVEPV